MQSSAYTIISSYFALADRSLVYFFQIIEYVTEEDMEKVEHMSAAERNRKPFQDIVSTAKTYKENGNYEYNEGNYSRAVRYYQKAVRFLEEYSVSCGQDDETRSDALFALHLNMSQCHLKAKKPARACIECKLALRHQDGQSNVMMSKLYYRQVKKFAFSHQFTKFVYCFAPKSVSLDIKYYFWFFHPTGLARQSLT